MRMLIVEDDPHLRSQVARHFSGRAWVVEEAADAEEAHFLGDEHPYDIAIVDLGLPGMSGIELVKHWREARQGFPILILTARSDWRDKVEGLEAGADDYVTKPFYLEEVEARVAALVRRSGGRTTSRVHYGPLCLDFSAKQVFLGESPIELTTYEFNTLEYLVHRQGQVVSKTELTAHLYDQDFDRDSNVIEVFIGRLRKKLDPQGVLKIITTVRGAGYRFTLEPSP
ncbi:MAG: response regulator transcription factor [Gammaproteobacteria bacterium]|nr:response regulator transcription factor [Gammaproteobacteria bacterium]